MRDEVRRHLTADRDARTLLALGEYQRRFPGLEAEVARVYAELTGGVGDLGASSSSSSGPGEAASLSAIGVEALSDPERRRLRIEAEIGRGGMGVVLAVRDDLLQRDLAMKRVSDGDGDGSDDATRASMLVRRLLQEAQVTAQLDHPGVVPVHELGLDAAGRVYFTMKRVHGRTLEQVLREARGTQTFPLSRALQVFLRICETLAYAHRKGVVHRDVKPANVMVGRYGEVYLMDWGLAKLVGADDAPQGAAPAPGAPTSKSGAQAATPAASAPGAGATTSGAPGSARGSSAGSPPSPLTMDGQMVGTLGYMPPEQVAGAAVDERADVYAVGAMLYELLAGHPPYREPGTEHDPRAALARMFKGDPAPLAERAPDAPPELVSIATKAMSRDPKARFASARELADELHAFLDGRVVRSHRTGVWVELRAWARRNRGLAAGLVAGAALVAGAVVAFVAQQRAAAVAIGEQRDAAVSAAARAEAAQHRSDGLRLAAQSSGVVARDPGLALAMSVEALALAPGTEARSAVYRALRLHREWRYLEGHEGYANTCPFLGDGRRLFSTDESGIAILWDVEAGGGLRWFDSRGGAVRDAVLSADEALAATAHADGKVRVWDLGGGGGTRVLDVAATSLHAGPGAELVTVGGDGRVLRWDLRTGASRELASFPGAAWLAAGARAGDPAVALLGADDRLHVRSLTDGAAWDLDDPAGARTGTNGPTDVWAQVSTPADRVLVRFASGSFRLLSLSKGDPVGDVSGAGGLSDAAFSADGRRLFLSRSVGDERTVEVRDAETGHTVRSFPILRKRLFPSPDGSLLALVDDTQIEVYDVERGTERCRLLGHRYHVRSASWSPDGRLLATASHDGTVRVWEIRRASEREGLVARARAGQRVIGVSDDAETALLLVGEGTGGATSFEVAAVETGSTVARVELPAKESLEPVLDPAGRWVSWMEGTTWRRFEIAAGAPPASLALAWPTDAAPPGRTFPSPDERRVAVRSGDAVLVFDAKTGAFESRMGEDGEYNRPCWHPDGDRLLLAHGARGEAAIYDAADGHAVRVYRGHTGFVIDATIDPAGARGASSAVDSSVRIFELETGRLLERTVGLPMAGSAIAFGPAGRLLSYTSNEHFLLDASPGASLAEIANLARASRQEELRLHADGKHFWIRDAEQRIRLFDLDAAAEGARAMARPVLPQDRVLFDRGRALAPGSVSAPFLARQDPGWAVLRGGLLLADGRLEEALAATGEARASRRGWARPAYLRARVLCALASREAEGSPGRARRLADARTELAAAVATSVPQRPLAAGNRPAPEFEPFLADPAIRARLDELGADLGE